MRNAKLYSEKVNSWDVLASSLGARLGEMPYLQPFYDELQSLITQARSVVLEQETARAQFHDAVGRRKEVERRGDELRGRIAAHLKAQLGFRSDLLRQFGLNPLPRIVRTTEDPQVPPPPEAAAPEAAASGAAEP